MAILVHVASRPRRRLGQLSNADYEHIHCKTACERLTSEHKHQRSDTQPAISAMRYVHVIMPIGSDSLASVKKQAITESVKQAGFEARFPTYLPSEPFHLSELII